MIPIAHTHSARILIVDDLEVNITILEQLLRHAGYTEVSGTSDATTVATLHAAHQYDLIVLDMNMPDMDGFAVLDSLRQLDDDHYLPVLVMSAEPEYKLRALQAGARDFVCKPCDYGELLTRIRNMLEVRLLYTGTRDYGLRMAGCDRLTGLANRAQFRDALPARLSAAWPQSSALLLIDLDGFTALNDTLGHQAGDLVLGQFALRLAQLAPPQASLSRLGNDEFALLLPALDGAHQVPDMVEAIRTALQDPFQLPAAHTTLSASIGVALCPGDAMEAPSLMRYADMALHQAQQDGPGACCYYTDTMQTESQRRFLLEHALRQASERDEFELYYQPKVQLSTGTMVGAEALLRWNRPGHGMVPPGEFIPQLEESGQIVQVGAWAIDTACAQIAAWRREGHTLPVAVNVASRQFAGDTLEQAVTEALTRHDVAPGMLSLEVTESALMDDLGHTARTLGRLRALGVRIAIDDFGTGYSSLAYLKRFPADVLKIDIAFIREVTSNPDDAAVVDAIIAMAHSLNLETVAEGVETPAQLAYLARRRCDQIQGYHFSRPLPAAQMTRLLQEDARLAAPAGSGTAPERTLLLIDDEPHVLSALQRVLRQDGYRVLAANGAAQAFQLLAENQVQLILCDQRMEEMSGTELLDRVKDLYPDTFRIILSGYTDLKTIMDSINRGALYRFYTKPWDNQTLRENIRAAFRHYWQLHGLGQPQDQDQAQTALAGS
jgi:diguanylate cyclase (GGDEF)-like protein